MDEERLREEVAAKDQLIAHLELKRSEAIQRADRYWEALVRAKNVLLNLRRDVDFNASEDALKIIEEMLR